MNSKKMDNSTLDEIIKDEDIKVNKVIKLLELDRSSYYRKRNDPNYFTFGEIRKLAEILNRPPEVIFSALLKEVK